LFGRLYQARVVVVVVVIICSCASGNYLSSDWLALLVAFFMRERPLTQVRCEVASLHALPLHRFTMVDCQVLPCTVILTAFLPQSIYRAYYEHVDWLVCRLASVKHASRNIHSCWHEDGLFGHASTLSLQTRGWYNQSQQM